MLGTVRVVWNSPPGSIGPAFGFADQGWPGPLVDEVACAMAGSRVRQVRVLG